MRPIQRNLILLTSKNMDTLLHDPKYTTLRHAIIAAVGMAAVGIAEAFSHTDFGPLWTPIVGIVSIAIVRSLSQYIPSTPSAGSTQ